MSTDLARDTEMLSEFAELALALAREMQAKALAAETVAEAAEAAQAFHAVGRSLRQSLALKMRLARDAARDARETRDDAENQAARARQRDVFRKSDSALAWAGNESECEAESLMDMLAEDVAEDLLTDEFFAAPVETRLARLRAALGPAAEQLRRSSA